MSEDEVTHDTHGFARDIVMTRGRREALHLVTEECSEVAVACMKAARHGFDSINPVDPGPTNLEAIADEMGDVLAAVDILLFNVSEVGIGADIEWFRRRLMSARLRKLQTIAEYLHFAEVPPLEWTK